MSKISLVKSLITLAFACSATLGFSQALSVVDTQASSSQVGYLGPSNLISNSGLTEDPTGSGRYRFSTGATEYTSGYTNPNDETPLVHFNFGGPRLITHFRVWNANNPGYNWRGFKDVTIQYSSKGTRWETFPERVRFNKGPGVEAYFGQLIKLSTPISAQYIRFCAYSTWRNFGNPDVAALGRVKFYGSTSSSDLDGFAKPRTQDFPADAGVINVKLAPYNAKGDGISDDTNAIQRAILDWQGSDRIIYLPSGTYMVSAPIRFSRNASFSQNSLFGRNHMMGAGSGQTTILLKPGTFTNPSAPLPILTYGFISFWNGQWEQSTADWFNNSIVGMTLRSGAGNPGAKGLEFFSNNTGCIRDVKIISNDLAGDTGLDLGYSDLNGPLLVKNLVVEGFKTGVLSSGTVNSLTFENIQLRNQSVVAFLNSGQCVSVRNLQTTGTVPGFQNHYGFAVLTDSSFTKNLSPNAATAMTNGEFLVARDIQNSGFAPMIENNSGTSGGVTGSSVAQYLSTGGTLSLFPSSSSFLRLPVLETPVSAKVPASRWVNIREFRLTSENDDAPALQRAIDSGAAVIYFPSDANITFRQDVLIRGAVQQILGFNARIQRANGSMLRLASGTPTFVTFDRIKEMPIFNQSSRSLVVLDSETSVGGAGTGKVFLENVGGSFSFAGNDVWARQLNSEPEGLKIENNGGKLWVLGLKTERAGTLVRTTNGGKSEILGGLCYTTTSGTDPMFVLDNGELGASIAEVSYGPPPYGTLVRETRGATTLNLLRGQAPFRFSFMNGSAIPLFRSGN